MSPFSRSCLHRLPLVGMMMTCTALAHAPLELIWALSIPEKGDKREALETQKAQFHELIEDLEAKQINGVEFECEGR